MSTSSLLRFITCGSVDDGKSTLIGRLLYESHLVFDDHLAALEVDSRQVGTQGGDLDFALLVDGLAAEREQGITIDVAYRFFATEQKKFIVADTPGHEQYTRNMVTGASTADAAVILIDARKGVLTQTRRHSFLVSLLGIEHVVWRSTSSIWWTTPNRYSTTSSANTGRSPARDRTDRNHLHPTVGAPRGQHHRIESRDCRGTAGRHCWPTWRRSTSRTGPVVRRSGCRSSGSTDPISTSGASPA